MGERRDRVAAAQPEVGPGLQHRAAARRAASHDADVPALEEPAVTSGWRRGDVLLGLVARDGLHLDGRRRRLVPGRLGGEHLLLLGVVLTCFVGGGLKPVGRPARRMVVERRAAGGERDQADERQRGKRRAARDGCDSIRAAHLGSSVSRPGGWDAGAVSHRACQPPRWRPQARDQPRSFAGTERGERRPAARSGRRRSGCGAGATARTPRGYSVASVSTGRPAATQPR